MNFRISSIKKIPKKPRCKITLDNGDFFILTTDIILKYGLSKDSVLNQEEINKLQSEQLLIDCKLTGFNYTSYKPRTKKQTETRLKYKGFENEQIKHTVKFLEEFHLLDDEKFAKNYVLGTLKKKSVGPNRIRIELLKKGIHKTIIDNVMLENYPQNESFDLAMAAAKKKMPQIERKESIKQKPALINFLKGQGFSWDDIQLVIKELLDSR